MKRKLRTAPSLGTTASISRAKRPRPIRSLRFCMDRRPEISRQFDGTPEVVRFAETLERVCVETVEAGQMTKDLAILVGPEQSTWMTTEQFFEAVVDNFELAMAKESARLRPASGEKYVRAGCRGQQAGPNPAEERKALKNAKRKRDLFEHDLAHHQWCQHALVDRLLHRLDDARRK